MSNSFLFYDLETTGISSSKDRILQFAAQRTDMDLNPIGEPIDIKIELAKDILPSFEACKINHIDPTKMEGAIKESEFTRLFNEQFAEKGTIFVGFNNLRFDDNFIRFLNYRNFYDPYKWHWDLGRTRWDIIDLVRMTRALRPDGINWPVKDGVNSNKLELLTKENNLDHYNAHDALSDVLATIEVAKLIKGKQPKLFDYLLKIRTKDEVIKLLNSSKTLVYTSTRYSSQYLNTTLVYVLDMDLMTTSAVVYDLRSDPTKLLSLTSEEIAESWKFNPEDKTSLLPIKTIKLNRCPAIASSSTLDEGSYSRLSLDKKEIENNIKFIEENYEELKEKVDNAVKILNEAESTKFEKTIKFPDELLFDGFTSQIDSAYFPQARKLQDVKFSTKKLNDLYKLFRARNFPESDSESEVYYSEFIKDKLISSGILESYIKELKEKIKLEKDEFALQVLNSLINRASNIEAEYANS